MTPSPLLPCHSAIIISKETIGNLRRYGLELNGHLLRKLRCEFELSG